MEPAGAPVAAATPGPPPTPPPARRRSAESVRAILLARRHSAPPQTNGATEEAVTRADRLESELIAARTLLACAEDDKAELEARVLELVDDKALLHVRLSDALANIRALESELSTASLKGYRAMLKDTDSGATRLGVDIAALRRENARLKASLKKLQAQPTSRQQGSRERAVAAEARSRQLATEVENLKRRLRFLENAGRGALRARDSRKVHPQASGGGSEVIATRTTPPQTRRAFSATAAVKPAWK